MDDGQSYARLLVKTLVALVVGAVLVALCYFFVDDPVAFYVHNHAVNTVPILKWLTYPPPILQAWTPLVLAGLMVLRAWGPWQRWELALIAAGVGMILADQFRESLSFVFGRYWPDTWINNNPSLIHDGVDAFHPFHSGSWYGSFPSGHMARTVGIASVVWLTYPAWRWACVAASIAVAVGLVGMNYHYVGDVIGGSLVGGIVGTYTAICVGLVTRQSRASSGAA